MNNSHESDGEEAVEEPFDDTNKMFDLVCLIKMDIEKFVNTLGLPLCQKLQYKHMHEFILKVLEKYMYTE